MEGFLVFISWRVMVSWVSFVSIVGWVEWMGGGRGCLEGLALL